MYFYLMSNKDIYYYYYYYYYWNECFGPDGLPSSQPLQSRSQARDQVLLSGVKRNWKFYFCLIKHFCLTQQI